MARRPQSRPVKSNSYDPDKPSTNELLADSTRQHAIEIDRFTAGIQATAVRRLRELLHELDDTMRSADWEAMTDFRKKSFTNKVQIITNTIKTYYDDLKGDVRQKLIDLSQVERKFIEKGIDAKIPIEMSIDTLTPTELRTIATKSFFSGTPIDEFWDRQSNTLRNKVTDAIRMGILKGDTNDQIRYRITGNPRQGIPSIMDVPEREARTVVRTSVQTVSNSARMETYKANRELIKGVQWVSTFDGRTSELCLARNGLVWLYDDDGNLQPDGHDIAFEEPPIHANCRSTLIPIVRSWKELGYDADEVPSSTKASMDGQIPEERSMDDWLRSKPKSFVEGMLGPGKAELFRSGKIDLKDLMDQYGNVKPLRDL